MSVDVHTEVVIRVPRERVAAYASNPDNAPEWYVNIASVRWQTEPPAQVGSRITFVARFLGRTLEYTYEISELDSGRRLVMRTAEVRSRWRPPIRGRVRRPMARAWRYAIAA